MPNPMNDDEYDGNDDQIGDLKDVIRKLQAKASIYDEAIEFARAVKQAYSRNGEFNNYTSRHGTVELREMAAALLAKANEPDE